MSSIPNITFSNRPPLPLAGAPRSAFHLSSEQIEFFDTHGYLILRQWVTGELLSRLQAAGASWIEQGQTSDDPDFTFAERGGKRVMFRVNYLHQKNQAASLELLGSPQVLAVAESLCGPNLVPTYESMVFKQAGDGEAIPWHQDAVHPRKYRIFNYDLYLDQSKVGGGALRVVPKSQTQVADICALNDTYGWEMPGVIHVEMQPGDVLLHDVMVVHGSEQTVGKALRRTIYYEFRAAEEIVEEGPWDNQWIERRLRLIPLALAAHQRQYPNSEQFDWQIEPQFKPHPAGDQAEELRIVHLSHTAGTYCSAGNAGSDWSDPAA
jgi:ectoine hydroxylase-related dioxygenase (phytanoyl-CoA dioxygenase family)